MVGVEAVWITGCSTVIGVTHSSHEHTGVRVAPLQCSVYPFFVEWRSGKGRSRLSRVEDEVELLHSAVSEWELQLYSTLLSSGAKKSAFSMAAPSIVHESPLQPAEIRKCRTDGARMLTRKSVLLRVMMVDAFHRLHLVMDKVNLVFTSGMNTMLKNDVHVSRNNV